MSRRRISNAVTKNVTALKGLQLEGTTEKIPYVPARLSDRGGDLSKRWLIEFYVFDATKEDLIRKQISIPSKLTTAKERYDFAATQIQNINSLLEDGYHIKARKEKAPKPVKPEKVKTVKVALDEILELRGSTFAPKTLEGYKSIVEMFLAYAKEAKIANLDVKKLTKKHIINFLDYRQKEDKISNSTRNNNLAFLSAVFGLLVERELIESNPCNGIKRSKVVVEKHEAFTQEERKKLLQYMEEHEPQLRLFCLTVYYCFIRPVAELRLLQVKHFELNNKLITIPAKIALKGKRTESVRIPEALLQKFRKLPFEDYDPEHYLFGKFGKPGPVAYPKNALTTKHKDIMKELEIPTTKTLYSWKHTGNIAAALSGINIKILQMQNRHKSLDYTDKYLRGLGVNLTNEMDSFPEA